MKPKHYVDRRWVGTNEEQCARCPHSYYEHRRPITCWRYPLNSFRGVLERIFRFGLMPLINPCEDTCPCTAFKGSGQRAEPKPKIVRIPSPPPPPGFIYPEPEIEEIDLCK